MTGPFGVRTAVLQILTGKRKALDLSWTLFSAWLPPAPDQQKKKKTTPCAIHNGWRNGVGLLRCLSLEMTRSFSTGAPPVFSPPPPDRLPYLSKLNTVGISYQTPSSSSSSSSSSHRGDTFLSSTMRFQLHPLQATCDC